MANNNERTENERKSTYYSRASLAPQRVRNISKKLQSQINLEASLEQWRPKSAHHKKSASQPNRPRPKSAPNRSLTDGGFVFEYNGSNVPWNAKNNKTAGWALALLTRLYRRPQTSYKVQGNVYQRDFQKDRREVLQLYLNRSKQEKEASNKNKMGQNILREMLDSDYPNKLIQARVLQIQKNMKLESRQNYNQTMMNQFV